MKQSFFVAVTLSSIIILNVNVVNAHHGLDRYDTNTIIELKGTVVNFELKDPHSLLFLDVENENGNITHWVVEGGAAHGIAKAGLTKQKLASKPLVTVKAYQSLDGNCEPECRASGRDFSFE